MINYLRTLGSCLVIFALAAPAQQTPVDSGTKSFETRCTVCHGGDGNGSERAPSILNFIASNPDSQIAALIRKGFKAMPPHDIADSEMKDLVAFLHTLRPIRGAGRRPSRTVTAKALGRPCPGRPSLESNQLRSAASHQRRKESHLLTIGNGGAPQRESSVT